MVQTEHWIIIKEVTGKHISRYKGEKGEKAGAKGARAVKTRFSGPNHP